MGNNTEHILLVFAVGNKGFTNYNCNAADRSTRSNVFYYDQTRDFVNLMGKGPGRSDCKQNFAQKPVALLCDLWSQLFKPYFPGYVLDLFSGTGVHRAAAACLRHHPILTH
jgi:hypothetical protein